MAKIWGTNTSGQVIKEHDKLLCTDGFSTWETHVQLSNNSKTKWHREDDYANGKVTLAEAALGNFVVEYAKAEAAS